MAWRADCHIDTLPYMHTGLALPSIFSQLGRGFQLPFHAEMPFPLLPYHFMVRFMHVMYAYAYSTVYLTIPRLTPASVGTW